MYINKRQLCIGYSFLVLLFLSGCTSIESYQQPISRFQKASEVVIASTEIYIREANKIERDSYLDQQANEKKSIKLSEIQRNYILTPDQWNLRLRALGLLSHYGHLLIALANHEAPDQLRNEIDGLGAAFKSLVNDTQSDNQLKNAIGPLSGLFGELANVSLEKKSIKALDKVITEGEPSVKKLITMMHDETSALHERRKSTSSKRRFQAQNDYQRTLRFYNLEKNKHSPDPWKLAELSELLNKRKEYLKKVLDFYDKQLFSDDFPQVFNSMSNAHSKLVLFAKSAKQPKDLSSFTIAVEDFVGRSEKLAQNVNSLNSK